MTVRSSGRSQSIDKATDKHQSELADQAWNALILVALKHQRKIGKYYSERYDRHCVYAVKNLRQLASILVNHGYLVSWPAGFRRLSTIEREVIAKFKETHDKYHTDT